MVSPSRVVICTGRMGESSSGDSHGRNRNSLSPVSRLKRYVAPGSTSLSKATVHMVSSASLPEMRGSPSAICFTFSKSRAKRSSNACTTRRSRR